MLKNLHLDELRRALSLMKNNKWKFLISCLATVGSITMMVAISSLAFKKFVNGIIYQQQEMVSNAIFLILASITLVCIVSPISSYLANKYAKKAMYEIRSSIFSHVVALPKTYFESNSSGEILSRLTNDLDKMSAIYDGELYVVLESLAIGSVSVIASFVHEWRLTIVVVVLGYLAFLVNTLYAKPIRAISLRVQSLFAVTTQRFIDLVAGNRTIKLFNIDNCIVGKFDAENQKLMEENLKVTKKGAEKDGVNYLLNGAYYVGVLGVGVVLVHRGIADLGSVVAVLTLRLGVDDLFTKFGSSLADLQKSLAGADRVFELIDEPEEVFSSDSYVFTDDQNQQKPILSLDNIYFSYDGKTQVLKGLDMTVDKGQVVALVGRSGAGKSTIIKLLLGLYAPESGKVCINTVGKSPASLEVLRDQFAYVSQDAYLFDSSIEENIRYGNPNATKEEVIEAAKAANAHNFISTLPQGYDTKVGENSTKLSGGQRQRVAIARALVKNAPVLLLDEATSALDSESEALVQEAINHLMQGRTTIVIAHRLSTVQRADLIYVIDEGRVIEQGMHEELLNCDGVYKLLYESQFSETTASMG